MAQHNLLQFLQFGVAVNEWLIWTYKNSETKAVDPLLYFKAGIFVIIENITDQSKLRYQNSSSGYITGSNMWAMWIE